MVGSDLHGEKDAADKHHKRGKGKSDISENWRGCERLNDSGFYAK
jgi:hypothetical protein